MFSGSLGSTSWPRDSTLTNVVNGMYSLRSPVGFPSTSNSQFVKLIYPITLDTPQKFQFSYKFPVTSSNTHYKFLIDGVTQISVGGNSGSGAFISYTTSQLSA